jgi:hypothetical protein
MTSAPPREPASPLKPQYQPVPALLSYLVPGLGQIAQGRVGKGILFFVCVLTLFYYGMYLGSWSNVYLPDLSDERNEVPRELNPWNLPPTLANLYNRPQFIAQFWVGIAAWPAVIQYASYDRDSEVGPLFGSYQRIPYEERSRDVVHVASDDPVERRLARRRANLKSSVALRDWKGKTLNELQNEGDKTWDLGWVLTVIAGALNVMVIFDALAGPAYVLVPETKPEA